MADQFEWRGHAVAGGETFHRDMMPAETCRRLCGAMQEFRGNTVLTFDQETKGAIVLERLDELGAEHPALAGEKYGVHRVRGADRGCAGERSGAGDVLRDDGQDESRRCAALEGAGHGRVGDCAADGISGAGSVDDRCAECGVLEGTCAGAVG